MDYHLNKRAMEQVNAIIREQDRLRVAVHDLPGGGHAIDCGLEVEGGLDAGLAMARVCMADLADVTLKLSESHGWPTPVVQVATDHPVAACMYAQYAGWQLMSNGTFYGMGSGPMRAIAAREPLFDVLGYQEQSEMAVGVVEGRQLPDQGMMQCLRDQIGDDHVQAHLLVAPTASHAGTVQVVARSVETCLHKLMELNFDLSCIQSALGTAPLPPVAKEDMEAIGRTNDAILYGGRVILWVRTEDEIIDELGPVVPSVASSDYGVPFIDIFERYNRDFYKIDPKLFSPAEVVFQNLSSGRSFRFGGLKPEILKDSFLGQSLA